MPPRSLRGLTTCSTRRRPKPKRAKRSLLHIIKPEIDFDPIADEHAEEVYDRAVENFRLWRERGWLQQDEEEHYYVYAQTMDGRTQYGLAMCCHFEDYRSGAIKKHELTRPDKEEDRMKHVRCQRANIEPVFFAYPDNAEIDALVEGVVKGAAPGLRLYGRGRFRSPVVGHPRPEGERPHYGDFQGYTGIVRRRRPPPHGSCGACGRRVLRAAIRTTRGDEEYCYLPGRDLSCEPAAHHRLQPRGAAI